MSSDLCYFRAFKARWGPFFLFRDVAQLVEYTSGGRVVARSSRVIPTEKPAALRASYWSTACMPVARSRILRNPEMLMNEQAVQAAL